MKRFLLILIAFFLLAGNAQASTTACSASTVKRSITTVNTYSIGLVFRGTAADENKMMWGDIIQGFMFHLPSPNTAYNGFGWNMFGAGSDPRFRWDACANNDGTQCYTMLTISAPTSSESLDVYQNGTHMIVTEDVAPTTAIPTGQAGNLEICNLWTGNVGLSLFNWTGNWANFSFYSGVKLPGYRANQIRLFGARTWTYGITNDLPGGIYGAKDLANPTSTAWTATSTTANNDEGVKMSVMCSTCGFFD